MRLVDWLRQQGPGAKAKLARDTGLGFNTILYLSKGTHYASGLSAALIEKHTKGAVTVRELVAPPKSKIKRKGGDETPSTPAPVALASPSKQSKRKATARRARKRAQAAA